MPFSPYKNIRNLRNNYLPLSIWEIFYLNMNGQRT